MTEFHAIDLNNIQLHYAEAPGPEPALVILHGLSGSYAESLHLVPKLAEQAHVYLLDLREHGLSGRGTGVYQLADYGHDVVAFLRQVVGQPAVVVGHSLGGIVAVWLAAHALNLLRGILLSDPGLYIMRMPRFEQSAFGVVHKLVDTFVFGRMTEDGGRRSFGKKSVFRPSSFV